MLASAGYRRRLYKGFGHLECWHPLLTALGSDAIDLHTFSLIFRNHLKLFWAIAPGSLFRGRGEIRSESVNACSAGLCVRFEIIVESFIFFERGKFDGNATAGGLFEFIACKAGEDDRDVVFAAAGVGLGDQFIARFSKLRATRDNVLNIFRAQLA